MSSDVVASFLEAMRAAGVDTTDSIIADGTLHRVSIDSDKGHAKSGWYVLHLDDPPSGSFGNWKTGEQQTWTLKDRKLSADEKRELASRIKRDREVRAAEDLKAKAEAAVRAKEIWSKSSEADPFHPYLQRKMILPGPAKQDADSLVIPVTKDGKLTSIQTIWPDGNKRFLPDGEISGCYCPIGKPSGVILICEGFATGVTLNQATGHAVVVAFNAGNLKPVCEAIRRRYSDQRLLVCGDNDQWTDGNPGLSKAREAGELWVIPNFKDLESKPTDFNDLFVLDGASEVTRQVEVALKPPEPMVFAGRGTTPGDMAQSNFSDHLPDQKPGKPPLATKANLEVVLQRLGATFRYNVISKKQEIMIPGKSYSLDNYDNAIIADIVDVCARLKMPTDKINLYLSSLCDQNQYNPVKVWIESKPWDGVSRLHELYSTVKVLLEDNEAIKLLKETLIKKWMISAVAAAFKPDGVSAHGMLVFQGAQNMGKTHWFKRLVPQELKVAADGQMLKPDDKDSVLGVIQNWLVELGELDATFRKADIAQLKAFMVKDRDSIRLPYAARSCEFPRRTVFFASVNSIEFLADPSGNRRFWALECVEINYKHTIDMQQLWAEVATIYASGHSWYLTPEELMLLNDSNRKFEVKSPIEDIIAAAYDWVTPIGWRDMTAVEVLAECGYDKQRLSQHDKNLAAHALKQLNGNDFRGSRRGRVYRVPMKLNSDQPSLSSQF